MAGNWGLLAKYLENSNKSGFEYQVGEALLSLMHGNDQQFRMSILNLHTTLGHAIVAAGTDSSRQCYDALARLHAVQELKSIHTHMKGDAAERRNLVSLLDERLNLMIPTAKYQQFALALRRAATTLSAYTPRLSDLMLGCPVLIGKSRRVGYPAQKSHGKLVNLTRPMLPFSVLAN
jgi:hypothetical protein